MTLLISVLEQGMIYAIMALGIYITYKILDFPDLTVDGSFPMGAAIAAGNQKWNGINADFERAPRSMRTRAAPSKPR